MIERKRFVLKTNDSNENEFFKFLRENLKLKKKFVNFNVFIKSSYNLTKNCFDKTLIFRII